MACPVAPMCGPVVETMIVGPKLMVGVVRHGVRESGIQQSGRVTIR